MKIREKVEKLPPFIRANRIKVPAYILLISLILFIVLDNKEVFWVYFIFFGSLIN